MTVRPRPPLPASNPAMPILFELAEELARLAARRQRDAEQQSKPEPKPR